MSDLTREERGRIVKGFLMVSGAIALAMVLFELAGQLNLATVIVSGAGGVLVASSPVLWIFRHPPRVYGIMVIGLAVIVGAVGGSLVITTVAEALR